jgi:hypothetical protein
VIKKGKYSHHIMGLKEIKKRKERYRKRKETKLSG